MPGYVLDTDTLSLYHQQHPAVSRHLYAHAADPVSLSVWTVEEQVNGWRAAAAAARSPARQVWASELLVGLVGGWASFPVLPLTPGAITTFDRLIRLRLNVGRYDLRIAATALDVGAAVVTRNRRDFGRVPGLAIEDWSA